MRWWSLFNRISLYAAFLALAGVALYAQPTGNGSVSGAVLDGQSGRPIAGVSVLLDGVSTPIATSDSDGRFAFSAPAGVHALKFRIGTHSGVDYRIENSLPMLVRALKG